MKIIKIVLYTILVVLSHLDASAQGEENIWVFGQRYSLDFNTTPPTLIDQTYLNGQTLGDNGDYRRYSNSIAVSDENGQLLFFVHLNVTNMLSTSANIYDRYEQPIPGTSLMNELPVKGLPVVIPHPSNSGQYYVFYVRSAALFYSLFDLNLNNGLGNIVPGQKNIMLSGFSTVYGHQMTAIKSCTGIWLVVRALDGFKSYLVDGSGIHPEPVLSEPGPLPIENFVLSSSTSVGIYSSGFIKASNNGKMMAVSSMRVNMDDYMVENFYMDDYYFPGGIELFDFEPCSGRLLNPRVVDSGYWYHGVCFSPDDSKLYATQNDVVEGTGMFLGHVYQFDVSLSSINDITNSKTLILTNPPTITRNTDGSCTALFRIALGDMKNGPDGKLYLLNQSEGTCLTDATIDPQISNPSMAFHIIHYPNNAGLSCSPEVNAIFNSVDGMATLAAPYVDLPRDLVPAPATPPDTLNGTVSMVYNCFQASVKLEAPADGSCFYWDNGTTETERTVGEPGTYYVRYFKECSVMTDTFHVEFITLPEVATLQYGCKDDITFRAVQPIGSSTTFDYTLTDLEGEEAASGSGNNDFTASGLTAGAYILQIHHAASGCDTHMAITLADYPYESLLLTPTDALIKYGDSLQLQVSGSQFYTWSPLLYLDSATSASPIAWPREPTQFMVVAIDRYGCLDTGYVHVDIDYTMPDIVPNAFSPNGDGLNDVFRIEGVTYQRVRVFNVFNRFGEKVFSTLDGRLGWDGMYKGTPAEVGTYYYLIELDYPDGRTKTYKGDVTLLR